jgi:hypothetical protein
MMFLRCLPTSGKTLFFLTAKHFHACTWKNGRLSESHDFGDNASGQEQFADFLQKTRSPAYLLTDLIEEDFRHETLPHLPGKERAAMILRKFQQYYRHTSLRLALPLQRQTSGRRDDEFLLCALTNPALLAPWLTIMQTCRTPLAGIFSIPNISVELLQNNASKRLLLLSWEKSAGLRQTYFADKLLRFSRLTQLAGGHISHQVIAAESARTQQYLHSLNLLPDGQALDILIVCAAQERPELEAHLQDGADKRYSYLDIQQVMQKLGAKVSRADMNATALFMHLLAVHPPPENYAAPELTRYFSLFKLRRGLLCLSAFLLAAGLFWSIGNMREERMLSAANQQLNTQLDLLAYQKSKSDAETFAAAATGANQLTSADTINAALLMRSLNSRVLSAQEILHSLSMTLDEYPRLRVNKLGWQAKPTEVSSAFQSTQPTAPGISLHGELQGFSGDYRGMLDYLERFQHALKQRGHTVTPLSGPLDISPQGNITADGGANDPESAQYAVKIGWSPAM